MPRSRLLVRVVTRDLQNPDSFKQKDIDYDNASDREWLGKHSLWSLKHNHSVLTYPL